MAEEQIQHVTDTALWVAGCRAPGTERPDALFQDPLAARLAGERGLQIDAIAGAGGITARDALFEGPWVRRELSAHGVGHPEGEGAAGPYLICGRIARDGGTALSAWQFSALGLALVPAQLATRSPGAPCRRRA